MIAAREKLENDQRHGAPASVINADKIALGDAQASAEQTAFSQRLSDAQTNERLGRISHAAYIQYLQNEHNRLVHIAHRTYQQQQELNQIDEALQAANKQLQGQFNLGNIKVPTVYDVRRSLKTSSTGGNQTVQSVINHIQINGADMNKVRELLNQLLGKTPSGRYTTSTRKGN